MENSVQSFVMQRQGVLKGFKAGILTLESIGKSAKRRPPQLLH
jgi:hypothetical protein